MVIKIPALICCALYNVRNVRWLSRFLNTTHKFSSGFWWGAQYRAPGIGYRSKILKMFELCLQVFPDWIRVKERSDITPPSIFRRSKHGEYLFLIIADELQTAAGSKVRWIQYTPPFGYTDNLFIEIFLIFFFYFLNLIFSWRGTHVKTSNFQ